MKMKMACESTGLTERAIRLYVKKGLVAPGQRAGILDFSQADIERLRDISALRQAEFSIEEIGLMLSDREAIRPVMLARAEQAQRQAEREGKILGALRGAEGDCPKSVHALAVRVRSGGRAEIGAPDFGRFDGIDSGQRLRERKAALAELPQLERRGRRLRAMGIALCAAMILAAAAALYLGHERISGYIGVSPLVVAQVDGQRATVLLEAGGEAAELIGREEICVPYRAFGSGLREGDEIGSGCTLAIELTNLDLMRLGISPLQSFRGHSSEMNEEWMRLVLRALFSRQEPEGAVLWVREISGLGPLMPWTERPSA